MLLQTNSYIVPKDKRSEHARLLRKFRQTLQRLGCEHFEVYEQVGSNWAGGEATGRFVQIMRFRDRKHQQQVHAAEQQDKMAQQFIRDFCALINFPYQQQQGLFAVGFYTSAVPVISPRKATVPPGEFVGTAGAEDGGPSVGRDEVGGTAAGGSSAEAATDAGERAAAIAEDKADPVQSLPLELPMSNPAEPTGDAPLDFEALDPAGPAQSPLAIDLSAEEAERIDAASIADDPDALLELIPDIADYDERSSEDNDDISAEFSPDELDRIDTPPPGNGATSRNAR